MKKVAILQSNYVPWKGYFDLINSVDEFILYDDMQYTRRDWRNRNRIKTAQGVNWMTIPVNVTGRYYQSIKDTEISDPEWKEQHWRTLQHCYAHAPFFPQYREQFEQLYRNSDDVRLSAINHRFLKAICEILGIRTRISWSMDYQLVEGKTERLVDLCRKAGGQRYLAGPSSRDYLDENLFQEAGIEVKYFDYAGYPEYPQLYPPFEHAVTILDLIFNVGPHATRYMKSFDRD